MSSGDGAIGALFLDRSRYYLLEEYPAKIAAAVRAIPAERLWWRPAGGTNAIGNLVLHLCGNVRQWVVAGIGGHPDHRTRDLEFSTAEGESADALLARLTAVLAEVERTLRDLQPGDLLDAREIQGRRTTVLGALYHVVEHFSTHTGQIVWIAKMWSEPGTVRFYDDANNAAPLFLPVGRSDIR